MTAKTVAFTVEAQIPARPDLVYEAWISSEGHAAMTGGEAEVDARVGGKFTAWDGYIWGTNLELTPGKKIVQSWRTTEFARSDADSRIEITLKAVAGGTRLTLKHSDVPAGQADDYRQGWSDHYFEPMKAYFSEKGRTA